jgi:hypothetical protein
MRARRNAPAGFEIGVATAWRYVQEAISLLSSAADDLDTAMRRIRLLAYAILDGTLVPIDRVAEQQSYYIGKHKRHGVNVQVIAAAAGRLVWASPALPGSAHDLTAASSHGIIDALTSVDVMTFADKGYQGAHGSVRTLFKRHRFRPKLQAGRRRRTGPTRRSEPVENERSRHSKPEDPDQAALLSTPSNRDRPSHPRPAPRRGGRLRTIRGSMNGLLTRT